MNQLEGLDQLFANRQKLLIVVHDNPDPDAIAAAAALRYLVDMRYGVAASIAYGGIIGLGEAIVGPLFLGGSTSLLGITTSITAAANGYPELAVSNAMGGIAAQTVFLAIADMAHRNINLEHAAASVANLMHGALLTVLLAIPLIAVTSPPVSAWQVHPASVLIIATYIFGLHLVAKAQTEPMWRPRRTAETRLDELRTVKLRRSQLAILWLRFAVLAVVVAFAGYVVAKTGAAISMRTEISETVVGGLLTAIATSLRCPSCSPVCCC